MEFAGAVVDDPLAAIRIILAGEENAEPLRVTDGGDLEAGWSRPQDQRAGRYLRQPEALSFPDGYVRVMGENVTPSGARI